MIKGFLLILIAMLYGCAEYPYEETRLVHDVYNTLSNKNVRIYRENSFSLFPFIPLVALEQSCPLLVYVDGKLTSGLQYNQYVDIYLDENNHTLKVNSSCLPFSSKETVISGGAKIKIISNFNFLNPYDLVFAN